MDNSKIVLENSKIQTLNFIENCIISGNVEIKDNCEIDNLTLRDLTITKSIWFFNSSINKGCGIHKVNVNGLDFENTKVESNILISGIETKTLSFIKSDFFKSIDVFCGNVSTLVIGQSSFTNNFDLNGVGLGNLSIIDSDFDRSININNQLVSDGIPIQLNINEVFIRSNKLGDQFVINSMGSTINSLKLELKKALVGSFYFNFCDIHKTKITGDNYNSNIVFDHCNFNKIEFDYFNNYSNLSIISAKAFSADSELSIVHSNLGKTNFYNVSWESFEKTIITHSILTEIITANIKWFDDEKLLTGSDEYFFEDFSQRKEIYRQLKYAMEKQGDRISSLMFKSLEFKAYKNELFVDSKWWRIWGWSTWKRFCDKIVLLFGQINNFGQNWIKPIIWIFIGTLFFYLFIVVAISEKLSFTINFSSESFNATKSEICNHIYAYPKLLNPTNSVNKAFYATPQC